jgi:predicted Zn-dependent protease
VTQAWIGEVIAGGDHLADALRWAERAVELEPDRPRWWNRLARLQLASGKLNEAKISIDTTLGLQPWDIEAWELTGYYAEEVGDSALATRTEETICIVQPQRCGS